MLKKDLIVKEKYNGVHPLCKCGCGQKTRYEAKLKDYCQWIHGHQAKVKGHFGDPKNPKRVEAIKATRKQKFASGEYNHILKDVSKPRSQKIKNKISKSGTGVSRPKPNGFGFGRVQSEKTRKKMSETAIQNIIKTDRNHTSGLEKTFANILDLLNIKYTQFLYAKDIKAFYDFYLPDFNTIIEVDGDFWHCNPDTRHKDPKYSTQKTNLERDKIKNDWALNNGYKIIRFWENDIKNNIRKVKQILSEATR